MKKINKDVYIKQESLNKVNAAGELISVGAGFLSCVNPGFAAIPIFVFALNRVLGLASEENIKKRIVKFDKKLKNKKISMEDFKNEMFSLSEHNEYIVLNNLRNILLTAPPETVDMYIEILIDFIMEKKHDEKETLCELVNQLNYKDMRLLEMIKRYIENGSRDYFYENIQNVEKERIKNEQINQNPTTSNIGLKMIKFSNRNIVVDENSTIFWKDFEKYFDLQAGEMGYILLGETTDDNGRKSNEWSYIGRAFVKFQSLGVVELDYYNTVGTISALNIERFHLTVFGRELLKYIK